MKNLYRQFFWKFPALLLLLFAITVTTLGQTHPGMVRIKVSEQLARQLEHASISRTSSGEVVTGVQSLDVLNRQYHVRRLSRVFPYAGKYEARHRKWGLHLWYEVEADKNIPATALVQSYRAEGQVLLAEPVYRKSVVGTGVSSMAHGVTSAKKNALPSGSNDPLLPRQWHYHNTGQSGGLAGADIRLFDAWKVETGKSNVIIAVTDGGIQTDHPDLAANVWVNHGEIAGNQVDDDGNGYVDDVHGYSFVTDENVITPDDHGTHVAGTVAAVNNNGIGVAGVAGGSGTGDGVRLMSCAVFHPEGSADGFPEAYVYSADNGAVISQNSWGYTMPGVFEQVVLEAIDYFVAEAGKDEHGNQTGPMSGGLVIFSTGNENDEGHYYPAYYAPVLAVASSTHRDTRAAYSNYGTWVDITAPGGETDRTPDEGVLSTLTGGLYGAYQGTSMACPHVSGVAGLLLSKYGGPGLSPEAIRDRLLHTVDDIDTANPGFIAKLGTGRLNAYRALTQEDHDPPSAVNDLLVSKTEIGAVTLTWTSPQDESGFTTAYDLRYSTDPLSAENFSDATPVNTSPPLSALEKEVITIDRLAGGTRHYFAIRSADFGGNFSALSNVVSVVTPEAPSIEVFPTSLKEDLLTAGMSEKTFYIRNEGRGPLTFSLDGSEAAFTRATPASGEIAPGQQQAIIVTFDASGLLAGTYQHTFVVTHNDPLREPVRFPLTLKVTNNGLAIANVNPEAIDFKAAKVNTTRIRTLTVANRGSAPLEVSAANASHPDYSVALSAPMVVQPFDEAELAVLFSPKAIGPSSGEINLRTNDPDRRSILIEVTGEGLEQSPVTATPSSFQETVAQGAIFSRSMQLRNHGSQDVHFWIEPTPVTLSSPSGSKSGASARLSPGADTTGTKAFARQQAARRQLLKQKFPGNSLVNAVGSPKPTGKNSNPAARALQQAPTGERRYSTGFEEFASGDLGEQMGWFSTQGFSVAGVNPDRGKQHLRSISELTGGGQQFALSPSLYEPEEYDLPRYSSLSMRVNLDEAAGNTWEIVPQDPWYVATRIRINADRSLDAMVIDNDYETHWRRVPVALPEGYFDLAIEYNSWGSDTSGFPTYLLFINNQHVFSGTGLGSVIGQLAIVSHMETTGPVLDIDELSLTPHEYFPDFIQPQPSKGIIPAGQQIEVALAFDASGLRFGDYTTDLIVRLDASDSLTLPAALTVTGSPAMISEPTFLQLESLPDEEASAAFALENTGGAPIQFSVEAGLKGLSLTPSNGTLSLREKQHLVARFSGDPGIYKTDVLVKTDFETAPRRIPLTATILSPGGTFAAPKSITFKVPAGKISTHSFTVVNDGEAPVSFTATVSSYYREHLTIEPDSGIVGNTPQNIILTVDARTLTPGILNLQVLFNSNAPSQRTASTWISLDIVPDEDSTGKIAQEVWTGISGRDIARIPFEKAPDLTRQLPQFASPENDGDNYGSRIRGYIRAPLTGNYVFRIASNDNSELWLSEDERPENKSKIAYVSGYTNPYQWDKFNSQKSAPVHLVAGARYYIEALHKEGVGNDHLAVGWELPDGTGEFPIPGERLMVFGTTAANTAPTVRILTPSANEVFAAPATIEVKAEVHDDDGNIKKVEFFSGEEKLATLATPPFDFLWADVGPGQFTLMVKATDYAGATDSSSVSVVVEETLACAGAGKITREQWDHIPGTLINSVPFHSAPDVSRLMTSFESPAETGDHYGARIRGYVCVPESGPYTFWIASNDKSELWLSANEKPENKFKIAEVSGYTHSGQWSKYASQQSAPVTLVAGMKYYIEALHKEGVGSDHLAVGWQLPDGTLERPIPGIRLLPWSDAEAHGPVVNITSPEESEIFTVPTTVTIAADAFASDGHIREVAFYADGQLLGIDAHAPYEYHWENVPAGRYALTAVAIDDRGRSATSPPVQVIVEEVTCTASGYVLREYWQHIPGSAVRDIPLDTPPDATEALLLFEGPSNAGTHYGARIRGFLCPPATGVYQFWIASNDHSELWLSIDDDPGNTRRIAFTETATGPREWEKHVSQRSGSILLTAGKRYYVEALHKQGAGSDHVAVGWMLPDGTLERPIAGNRLSPYAASTTQTAAPGQEAKLIPQGLQVNVFPNPVHGESVHIRLHTPPATTPDYSSPASMEIIIRRHTGVTEYRHRVEIPEDGEMEIPVHHHFPLPGLYFLQIKVAGKTSMHKLVVP